MTCDNQNLSLYRGKDDVLCPASWKTISVDQGMERSIYAILYKMDPEDSEDVLPEMDSDIYVDLRFKLNDIDWTEIDGAKLYISEHHNMAPTHVVVGEYITPDRFKFNLTSNQTCVSGIYVLDLILYIGDKPVIARKAFLEIEPNALSGLGSSLSIADIRMALRDNCPEANYLIDDYDFTDKEIFSAMRRTVDYWNETTPDLIRYSYASFPYRFHWTNGTIGLLLKQAATHKLRNHLDYSAGGISVNENTRWKDYFTLGDKYWNEYIHWVANKKYEINVEWSYLSF